MGNDSYLIPANSKKSMLILGFFTATDLIVFGTGLAITFILLFIVDTSTVKGAFTVIVPTVISAFLVLPIPNHHNIRVFIINIINFYTNVRTFYWRGWCIKYGEKK